MPSVVPQRVSVNWSPGTDDIVRSDRHGRRRSKGGNGPVEKIVAELFEVSRKGDFEQGRFGRFHDAAGTADALCLLAFLCGLV